MRQRNIVPLYDPDILRSAVINGKSVADGREGRKSLILSNAIYLSSWEKRMVELPAPGSDEELDFEKAFEAGLAVRWEIRRVISK